MPNWVYNTLSIEGSPELIQKVKTQLNQPYEFQNTDFITNEVKTTTYSNPVIAFWNIVQPPKEKHDLYHASANGSEDKTWNWYSWNVSNWGTKWDIGVHNDEKYSDTGIEEETDKTVVYKFNTAWSPPLPVIEELSTQYPELEITLEYEEEQGWGGEIFWDSTGSSIVKEWDIPNSHADYVDRDNEEGCACSNNEDEEDWYSDCPGKSKKIELHEKKDVVLVNVNP